MASVATAGRIAVDRSNHHEEDNMASRGLSRSGSSGLRPAAFSAGVGVLLAQIVWNRQLVLLLGGSVDAATSVLSAFMLGLGLGGWWFGRAAQSRKRPEKVLRTALVLCALLSALPVFGSRMAAGVYPALYGSGFPVLPMRFLLSLTLVFPATFMAGGIVPVMARMTEGTGGRRETARLYGLNAIGSAFGGFLAGFVLLEAFGAGWTLAAGMVLLALPAIMIRSSQSPYAVDSTAAGVGPKRFLLLIYGLSGMLALSYESVWARQLSYVLGNSTYAFALLGVMVLLGIGIGSLLGGILARHARDPLVGLGGVEIALGLASVVPLSALGLFNELVYAFPTGSWPLLVLSRILVCGLYMLPSALLMGATFPLVVMAAARGDRLGLDVGRLTLANCLGAALGPVLVSMVLFRYLGVTASTAVLASGSVLLGAALFASAKAWKPAISVPPALAVVVAVVSLATPPGSRPPQGMDLAFFEEGRTATISVFARSWDNHRSLRINGVEEVPVDQPSLEAFYLLGHLPWGYNPQAESAMIVALGGGITSGALLTHPLDQAVCADLCDGLQRSLPLYADLNRRPDLDSRFTFVVDDGRNYLLGSRSGYDIIVCDATHPGSVDSWVLYTTGFYRTVRRHLNPSGVAAQWVPLHQLPPEEMRRILATWARVFPHSAVHVAGGRHLILIGSKDALALEVGRMFETTDAAAQLESVGYSMAFPEQMEPLIGPTEMAAHAETSRLASNSDLRAPCQFIKEKMSTAGQRTITPNLASAVSLGGGRPSRLLSAQMLYWKGELPAAHEMLTSAGSPLERRWLAVVLTTEVEQLHLAGKARSDLWLLDRAVEADSGWYRPRAMRRWILED